MVLLLTGPPGVGKTTVVRAVAGKLAGTRLGGFYTQEIRARGERRGFRLVTFTGEEATMAHVDFPAPRVSRYGVEVGTIGRFAATTLDPRQRTEVYLVDEIGKMECLSPAFIDAMRRLLDAGRPIVATIAQRGTGFIQEVKRRRDAALWTVTKPTREALPDRIVEWLRDVRFKDASSM